MSYAKGKKLFIFIIFTTWIAILWIGVIQGEEIQFIKDKYNHLDSEQKFWINNSKEDSELIDMLIYHPPYKNEIMPSCFKEVKGATTHKR